MLTFIVIFFMEVEYILLLIQKCDRTLVKMILYP